MFFERIMAIDLISFGYAATVAFGGIFGFVKAGSVPSLAAGLLFGSVLGFGAYQTTQNPNNYTLLCATSLTLAAFMGYRFFNSGKIMPAGVVMMLSLLMVGRFAFRAMTSSPTTTR